MSTKIYINQIEHHLKSQFSNLIDVSDARENQKEDTFLTRALAAFSLMHVADLSAEQAAASIVDGFNDNGIDAVAVSNGKFYLVQSKWHKDGKGSITRGDNQKFLKGIKDLLSGKFDRFNEKIKNKEPEITNAMFNASTRFILVLALLGQRQLGTEVERDIQDFLNDNNEVEDVISYKPFPLTDIYQALARGVADAPINIDGLEIQDWGQIAEPFIAYYGQVSATTIAEWYEKFGSRLFAPNIRMYLGETDVNKNISETLENEPDNFWYFNNGITVLCESIQKKPYGGNTRQFGIFECQGIVVVNGAQTVGSIARTASKDAKLLDSAKLLVRLISLQNCPETFAQQITRANNTQNRIEARDFVSLDKNQERLQVELRVDNIDYSYKAGDTPQIAENSFDLIDATVALACAYTDVSYSTQVKSQIGKVFENLDRAPYKTLFNSALSGRDLWKRVQLMRVIDRCLRIYQLNSDERRIGLISIHGNRFIAYIVFQEIFSMFGENVELSEEVKELIEDTVAMFIELIAIEIDNAFPTSYPANIFKSVEKCRVLSAKLLRKHNTES